MICERPHLARGWCNMHYKRWRTTGDPGARNPAQVHAAPGEPLAYLLAVLTTMPTECTPWEHGQSSNGYGELTVDGVPWKAHVYVCTLYHGPRPPGLECCHSCGNGAIGCFTPGHLRWDTPATNRREGRSATLTQAQIDGIRQRYAAGGVTQYQLAAKYGVRQSTISRIINGVRWRTGIIRPAADVVTPLRRRKRA